jgi:hypothetical protein
MYLGIRRISNVSFNISYCYHGYLYLYSYQWIFIRDTVETVIKPEIEGPIPIMELLDKKLAVQQSMVS